MNAFESSLSAPASVADCPQVEQRRAISAKCRLESDALSVVLEHEVSIFGTHFCSRYEFDVWGWLHSVAVICEAVLRRQAPLHVKSAPYRTLKAVRPFVVFIQSVRQDEKFIE